MSDQQAKPGMRYFTTSIMMLLVIGLIAVAVSQGWVTLDEDVAFEANLPETLTLDPSGGEVPLSYRAGITNNTDETVYLEAQDPCHIHRWFVADENGNFVQGEPKEECAQVVMNATLNPGDKVQEDFTLMIDSQRYQPGREYQLVVSYWGYEKRHVFAAQ